MTPYEMQSQILSDDYMDIILSIQVDAQDFREQYKDFAPQIFGGRLGMIHVPRSYQNANLYTNYSQLPKLYTTLDTVSLEASGILRVQTQPSLGYQGENVILGFIDTGIDYTLPAFRNPDGTSRILNIWDQTIPSETPPRELGYGTVYSREQINQALFSQQPFSIVPSFDYDGHGTFLAGTAAGSQEETRQFSGAAPRCDIAMIKLKPAKSYLRERYLIPETAMAYQETDIMMAILHLVILSVYYEKPLVICLALGTNQGAHDGTSPLDRLLTYYVDYQNCFCACAAGNESGKGHHFFYPGSSDNTAVPGQSASASTGTSVAELVVDSQNQGFTMEFWASSPSLYQVSVTSPQGESTPAIPPRQGLTTTYNFITERSILEIQYEIAESGSGAQLVIFRFLNPTPGIWRLNIRHTDPPSEPNSYHLWLPISGFISDGTVFLNPNPYTTVTNPGNTEAILTLSGYDAYSGSLFLNSSRGYARNGNIKPELAAPAVNVYGPAAGSLTPAANTSDPVSDSTPPLYRPPLNPYIRKTGTSWAAAITAGALALFINWNLDRGNLYAPFLTNRSAKNYLIRGAERRSYLSYPNQEWGYGTLDLYGVFEALI